MSVFFIDILLSIGCTAIGIACGWFLFGSHSLSPIKLLAISIEKFVNYLHERKPASSAVMSAAAAKGERIGNPEADEDRAANITQKELERLLEQVHELTESVRSDVGEHTDRMARINEGLVSRSTDANSVTGAISQLIDANKSLGDRLNQAEMRLLQQSQIIQSQTVEARTDALTALPNRRVFDHEMSRRLQEFQKTRRPTSLMMLDIDHFKKFNDTYGHMAGDEVLKSAARTLERVASTIGGAAIRFGGEEFAVILPGSNIFDSQIAAARVVRAVASMEIVFEGQLLQVTTSCGVAEVNRNDDEANLIKRADSALYAAKNAGRNRAYWNDGEKSRPVLSESQRIEEPAEETPVVEEKRVTVSGGEEFRGDIHRRLHQFKRDSLPISLIVLAVDRYEDFVANNPKGIVKAFSETLERMLIAAMRDMDHVGRIADGRYGILLPSASINRAAAVSDRLRKAVERFKIRKDDDVRQFSISCGVTEALQGDGLDHIFLRAEAALGKAIEAAGNRVALCGSEMEIDSPVLIRTSSGPTDRSEPGSTTTSR
ncbi:GGDEF domain-containing protein [Blastopirellula marina]|uniref:diguanylate cyclase n=1 Tax=Blastopirellula marina DSM 3645 TaxID=314230 RepID=A3ZSM7_9BACT|nr:GGDEF domain-containing protein [Blastopirellula marina]EAQ80455.1 putative diguanylate cyclase (GGDEF) [Blastopirellula marina DSM 3645]